MDSETLSKLQAADDARHAEYPPGVDRQRSIERLHAAWPLLDEIVGRRLSLDDQVQDASYFAELFFAEPREDHGVRRMQVIVSVAFSSFGSLVTICHEDPLSPEMIRRMEAVLAEHGFVGVDSAQLRLPYTGPHPGFAGKTWFDRFFNYL